MTLTIRKIKDMSDSEFKKEISNMTYEQLESLALRLKRARE